MGKRSSMQAGKKTRPAIPREVQRKLLLECGYECSIPRCSITQALEFHHINGDSSDSREENLLVLCAVHHAMAGGAKPKIDRKACEQLKKTIVQLSIPFVFDKEELSRQYDGELVQAVASSDPEIHQLVESM